MRVVLVDAPHVRAPDLMRHDERMVAHLDGLSVAGDEGWRFCEMALETPSTGAVFTAAALALESRPAERLGRLLTLTKQGAAERTGLISAFGWVEPDRLHGVVVPLLASADSDHRLIGIAACAVHLVDPGLIASNRLLDSSPLVRARALRTAGEIGYQDAAQVCAASFEDEAGGVRFWSTWSSVMLGNRSTALDALARLATEEGEDRPRAFRLALQAMVPGAAHALLQEFARDRAQLRWLIEGSGIVGDPAYAPWLISHMKEPTTARVAGEAFSLITGVDLDTQQLYRERPANVQSGATDDAQDENVAIDADEGLMWPDVTKIEKWWAANSSRFTKGQRYFMGAPVTREHCIDVLKNGYQRQRILAAHYLCLLEPGTPLFNTSAPARRQQRLLAQMK
jgi:uncharacterized protein (TIGR02270 family)